MTEFLAVILTWPVVFAAALIYFRTEVKGVLAMLQNTRRATLPNGAVIDFAAGDPSQRQPAETIENRSFQNETIRLDGKNFLNCRFENVVLQYSGEGPFSLQGSQFHGHFQFMFDGPAARAVQALSAMYTGFGDRGRETVEMFFDSIRNPAPHSRQPPK